MVGRVFCIQNVGGNDQSPAKLVPHFISKTREKTLAGVLYESLQHDFIRERVLISYAIRNIIIHSGGYVNHSDLLEPDSLFRISEKGWKSITSKVNQNDSQEVKSDFFRGQDYLNIVKLFEICEKGIDKALMILVAVACQTLNTHIEFLQSLE